MTVKTLSTIVTVILSGMVGLGVAQTEPPVLSFDTGFTVSKVRSALKEGKSYIVASSYEGTLVGLAYDGSLLWTHTLSGFMNQDLWCEDITGDGSDLLAVHGVMHGMSTAGTLYLFQPLAEKPAQTIKITEGKTFGDFRVCDVDRDGSKEILLGASSMIQDAAVVCIDLDAGEQTKFDIAPLGRQLDRFGYRVAQPDFVSNGSSGHYFVLFGSRLLLVSPDMKTDNTEVLTCRFSFNDMWQDTTTGKIILASCQSGGSCVHILDPKNPGWKEAYANLMPPGKINAVIKGTLVVRDQHESETAFWRNLAGCGDGRSPMPGHATVPTSTREHA